VLPGVPSWTRHSTHSIHPSYNTLTSLEGIYRNPEHQGQLYLFDYTSTNTVPEPLQLLDFPASQADFHPLGIEYHAESKTLYVINHAQAGTRLELFRLWPGDHAATHLKTIIHPQIHSPNSLAVIDEHSLYITNDHFFLSRYHPWLAQLETWLGLSTGNVIHFNTQTNSATVLDRIAFTNGVAMINNRTLAVASSSNLKVYIYHAPNDDPPKLYLKHTISVPFLPDNLSVDSNGKLLISGHPHPFSMVAYAKSRDACRSGVGAEKDKACALKAATGVAEWTEGEGLKVLWMSEEFATGSTAVRDAGKGVGIVSGLYDNGLLIWRE
jgi:arylesterase/paraoxonase